MQSEIRPIRNERDYESALKEIDKFIDAAEGTPERDKLEIWTALVSDFESRFLSEVFDLPMQQYKDVYRVVIHTDLGPETIGIRGDSLEDCFREVYDGPNCPPTRYNYHRKVEIVRYAPVEVAYTVPNLSHTLEEDETLQGS